MTGEQDQPRPEGHEDVGSLGEEAARLLGALSHWAREHADDAADPAGDHASASPVGDVAAAVHRVDGEIATGSAECRWCPVCRVVHAARQTSPEVREHLVAAAGSLLEAASSLLATHVPQDAGGAREDDATRVERIDLDADDSTEDWGEDGPPAPEPAR